ncbi:MAG: hypothetical protein F6J96_25905 [Symploca sp. SIO1C2]|nr:hypothetical protein [Symploca sp. SIO1C2]
MGELRKLGKLRELGELRELRKLRRQKSQFSIRPSQFDLPNSTFLILNSQTTYE